MRNHTHTTQPESVDELRVRLAEIETKLRAHRTITSTAVGDGYTIGRTPTVAYAHCGNVACPGHPLDAQPPQLKVPAIKELHEQTYGHNGGDDMYRDFVERSWEELHFEREEDAECPHCGTRRQLSKDPRPVYANLSGKNQNELLRLLREGLVPRMSNDAAGVMVQQAKTATLDTESAEFRAAVAEAVARALGQRINEANVPPGRTSGVSSPATGMESERASSLGHTLGGRESGLHVADGHGQADDADPKMRALAALREGRSNAEAAIAAGKSARTVERWAAAWRSEGRL
jgi:hypothetical protein